MTMFIGTWIDRKHYVWVDIDRDFTFGKTETWYVPCGCDKHGDHLGCHKCGPRGCAHPKGVSVSIQKVTESGEMEHEWAEYHQDLDGNRPPKKPRPDTLREARATGWDEGWAARNQMEPISANPHRHTHTQKEKS